MRTIRPSNLGWLEDTLTSKESGRLWEYIYKAKDNAKLELLGHLDSSLYLHDEDDWFFNKVCTRFIARYIEEFGDFNVPTRGTHPFAIETLWMNTMKQTDYNPFHNHFGVYSFVIWLNIPTDWREQYALCDNSKGTASNFEFHFTNIIGEITSYQYELDPTWNDTMLFFPSKLNHGVYPFFNCDEDRVSVSGNICLNTLVS